MRLNWRPAEASAGTITYRVWREAKVPLKVADGPDTCAIDQDPPTGPKISYRVVTVREGQVESAPAGTARFQVLPDAEDLLVTEQRGCVVGQWRVPAQATDVRVTRDEPQAGGDQVQVQCDRTSFRDSSVVAGTTYLYRITCGYEDAEGGITWSAGQTSTVSASWWPDPVTGQQVMPGPDGETISLQWKSPGAGKIVIILGPSAMPAEESELAAADVAS